MDTPEELALGLAMTSAVTRYSLARLGTTESDEARAEAMRVARQLVALDESSPESAVFSASLGACLVLRLVSEHQGVDPAAFAVEVEMSILLATSRQRD